MATPSKEEIGVRLAALAQVSEARDPVSRLARRLGEAAMWLFLAAILLSVFEVVARYAFQAPTTWIHPTTSTLCAIGFALGGAYCMARREHISVSYLSDRLPPVARYWVSILSLAIGAFYLAAFGYAMWLDAGLSIWRFDHKGHWNPELTPGPPNWPLPSIGKAALLIGTILFLAVVLVHAVARLRRRGE